MDGSTTHVLSLWVRPWHACQASGSRIEHAIFMNLLFALDETKKVASRKVHMFRFPWLCCCSLQKYDESLGELAQKHASECRWAPNTVARAQFPTTGLGENLAFRFGSEVNSDLQVTRFVHEWYAESAFFEYDTGLCAAKETCSHYMQVRTYNIHEHVHECT